MEGQAGGQGGSRGESGRREPLRDRSSPAPPRTAGTGGREPEAPLVRARRPTGTFATRAVQDSAARVALVVRPPYCARSGALASAVRARGSASVRKSDGWGKRVHVWVKSRGRRNIKKHKQTPYTTRTEDTNITE